MQANDLKALEQEIKELIVAELQLEDLEADDIDPAMPLFGGGLGLSSVNALQLDVGLRRHFAAELATRDARGGAHAGSIDLFRYSTVRLLAEHIGGTVEAVACAPEALDVGARRRAALLEKMNGRKA